jgi:transposase
MRKALPTITEDVGTLKHRLQHEHDGRKKPRLQMLYLLASGQAHTRQEVAHLLSVDRNIISHWLVLYESGGLDPLLALYVPAGKPWSLPPDVLAALMQALRQPAGVASYVELRQRLKQTHHLEVNYHTLYSIVRTRLQAKLKVPRPSHTKKPGGHSCVSGHVPGAATARHSAGQYPPGARMQPRRQPAGPLDGAPTAPHGPWGPTHRSGPAYL